MEVKQLRALVKPFVSAPSKLSNVQLLLTAAARRVITQECFEAIKAAFVAGVRIKAKKQELLALEWPEERTDVPEAAPKRKRPDVALRKLQAGLLQRDVVTATWRSFCKPPYGQLLPIEDALRDHNRMAFEAHELANDHVQRLLREGKDVVALDQSFFSTCCNAVCVDGDGSPHLDNDAHPELYKSAIAWQALRPVGYAAVRASGLTRALGQTLSQQMATECGNMVMTTFYLRFTHYVRDWLGCDGAEAYRLIKKAYDILIPPPPQPGATKPPKKTRAKRKSRAAVAADALPATAREDAIVEELVALFPRPPTDKNLSKHPAAFMPLLREFQRRRAGYGRRAFSLLPHTDGFTTKFLKINGNTLRQLIMRAVREGEGIGEDADRVVPNEQAFNAGQRAWWEKFFHVRKMETGRRTFGNELLTDGKSVKITMSTVKAPAVGEPVPQQVRCHLDVDPATQAVALRLDVTWPRAYDEAAFDDVQGIDPGVRDMFVSTNLKGHVQRCSGGEFYHDAKYTKSTARIATWVAKNERIRALVRNMPCKHDTSREGRAEYATCVLRAFDELKAFYGARRLRNLKLLRHIYAKKKLRDICKKLTAAAGSRTLLAPGDFSHGSGGCIRGRRAPLKKLWREAAKVATVMVVDEDFTSKTCNCCKRRAFHNMCCHKPKSAATLQRLEGRWHGDLFDDWDVPPRRHLTHKIHSMLHCSTNGCSSKTVNRDINASKNILELAIAMLRGLPRPAEFCRV